MTWWLWMITAWMTLAVVLTFFLVVRMRFAALAHDREREGSQGEDRRQLRPEAMRWPTRSML